MATVINNPGETREIRETDSGTGLIVGTIIALILIALFFIYGLPALRSNTGAPATPNNTSINVEFPTPGAQPGTQNPPQQ